MTAATFTTWELVRMADVASPDAEDSPGAVWLRRVADALDDIDPRRYPEDAIHEAADSVVPIYTHERWRVFVDLAAYQEDVTELGADASDLTACAGVALYAIAERLLTALVESQES